MTDKEIKKVINLFERGYTIIIIKFFLDGPITNIYEENGKWVFESDLVKGEPLSNFDLEKDVKIYREFDIKIGKYGNLKTLVPRNKV